MEILIIGGTRNVGHLLTLELRRQGHSVTVLNRGKTPDELPEDIQRLHCDRSDAAGLAQTLAGRSFDVVVDMALYNEADAKAITQLLDGRVAHYIFLSTGQVYLVRDEAPRPFSEKATESPITQAPPAGTRDYDEWLYGVEKSKAEDVLLNAWHRQGFPFTTLRLPMVNSERDHFQRIRGYLLRLQDGGPIVLPQGKHLLLRHVYAEDVIQAITRIIQTGAGKGRVYNISQDETLSIESFLELLARITGHPLQLKWIERAVLDHHQLLPECSPFSDSWMSELDNQRSKLELGMQYTPLTLYIKKLVAHYENSNLPLPDGYKQRPEELRLASES